MTSIIRQALFDTHHCTTGRAQIDPKVETAFSTSTSMPALDKLQMNVIVDGFVGAKTMGKEVLRARSPRRRINYIAAQPKLLSQQP